MPEISPNSAAFDVATGLMLMYLLLSLSCTFINEWIATTLKLRAKLLQEALTRIIDVPSLRADFYKHGMIDVGMLVNRNRHTSYLSSRSFALGLLAALDKDKTTPSFDTLLAAVQKLPDSNIRDVIFVNMVDAEENVVILCGNIARWFDQVMDRVSGLYNRKLKAISLAVGLILAVAINADTLAVSQSLWHDSSLRAQMLASSAALPTGREGMLLKAEDILRPLPIGWNVSGLSGAPLSFWLAKATGWLMTGGALSLGASFWFDLLSRFINLRGTGKRPVYTIMKTALAN